jgi:ribonuclease Y
LEHLITIIVAAVVGLGAFAAGLAIQNRRSKARIANAESTAQTIIEDAKREAENAIKTAHIDAKEIVLRARAEFEKESRERKDEIQQAERRLVHKEENIEKKADFLENKDNEIKRREKACAKREQTVEEAEKQQQEIIAQTKLKLEKIAGLTSEEAKQQLVTALTDEARHEAAKMIKQIEAEAKEEADNKAKNIIGIAIQRYAGDYVTQKTVSVIDLPDEEMKGRIIGREGRNIRALEAATGVDVIIDDTPMAVILSSFNPVRREVARQSLEKLIADGRIHPARIEEIVEKTKTEVDAAIKQAGEQAAFDLGIHGLHPEVTRLIGRLKYRTSYSQNQWQHSIEVGFLCGVMASELGLNVKQARRAGLLHDIGKAVDHEVEGSHAVIGADLAKRYGESPKIIHAIKAHHEDEKPESLLAVLVQAADALSGARPGARHEMLESYIKRLDDLEKICAGFPGVEKSFAMQAGREVRVIVENSRVNDDEVGVLSKEIAKKIESELTYPGQIKVTVIRELRAVEFAK